MKQFITICLLMPSLWVTAQNTPLPASVADDIYHLICEEKLARDVYQFAEEKYQMPVFAHKVVAEENHRTLLTGLLDTLPPISYVYGEFPAGEWSQLFQTLKAEAGLSLDKALSTGAWIEEKDIYDLEQGKLATTDTVCMQVYEVLIAASEQHLRSFLAQLQSRSISYTPKYLSPARMSEIQNQASGCDSPGKPEKGCCDHGN